MNTVAQTHGQTQRFYQAMRQRRVKNPQLKHYALVDGASYLTLGNRFSSAGDALQWQWLLEGTELDGIKHAGPALVAFTEDNARSDGLLEWLISRDVSSPLVSWLWSETPFESLAKHLRSNLFTRLPDGRRALFRYYNPTVRRALQGVLSEAQHAELMRPVAYWQVWQPLENDYLTFASAQTMEVGDA